jgi:hypothetical protein
MISLHPVGRWPMSNRVNLFYVIWADIGNMEMEFGAMAAGITPNPYRLGPI